MQLIVTDRWETATVQCMFHREGFPHTQLVGSFDGRQPYLRHRASRKAPLWRANPCSAIGKVDSQLEAPFSLETLRALCRLVGSLPISSDALCASCSWRIVRASDLAFLCKPLISAVQVSAYCRIRAASGAVTFCDVLC